ncbi:MAG: hypothetical protein MRZ79_14915 [Bacteroidia bacterium]|nr:hypothetical protein [Bacteroidia bacterium]
MKKDIPLRKVHDIIFAVIPRKIKEENSFWDVYLINLQDEPINNAIVSSKGFGLLDGKEVETSTLRHFFEHISPVSYQLIEPIQAEVTNIHNQYWLSFTQENYLYDKKYTFVQGSIEGANLTDIPLIGKKGVMIG